MGLDWAWLPQLAHGLKITMELTAACMAMGAALGIVLALLRVYARGPFLPLFWLASAYVQFFRGTPLLVQLMIIHFGLPSVGIRFTPFLSGLIAMGLNTAAYQAEYFRGAIQAVKAGQMLAARSLGMTRVAAIRHVVLPQALRLALPPWSNELIYMLKYSTIVYMIGVMDLMGVARTIAARNFRFLELFSLAAVIYLGIVLLLTFALRWVERRIRVPGLGSAGRG
ncbi:amino acid ABC transporter permease [Candidatus Bipolaricaulota bacterium]|nr:amino acid ABC transporter permease [Candidatus Bipolaricaulota bacterium]